MEAMKKIQSLPLFSNIKVNPHLDDRNEGCITLKEEDQKSAQVTTEWTLFPEQERSPSMASFQTGTVTFEHRNIQGLNRSLIGSVITSNFWDPKGDLTFQLDYVHSYQDGVTNPRNRIFKSSFFNSKTFSRLVLRLEYL
ncbi:hypothetical protein AALP_AA8G385800 [Arabis alpina]|uniref:Uncharacterized protein n=1 Tax=Arabis alpina TaxID=50452 RepID=A0A087GC57_ARAAL|nr:hypothetical protein AALP_AA8G385800 [Arabis alpina]